MKNFKKYLVLLFCLTLLSACGRDKIVLPKPADLDYIKVVRVTNKIDEKEILKIENQEEIKNFVDEISGATKTKEQSIQDEPVNVDMYFKVEFYHKVSKDNPSKLYIYKTKKYTEKEYIYFEQPYRGIFKNNSNDLKFIKGLQ